MTRDFAQAVRTTADRTDVSRAVDAIYADLQSAVDVRRPRCDVSGRCCRFEEFGHRLYVTTAEMATFMRALRDFARPTVPQITRLPFAQIPEGCPYQLDRQCTVHAIRPFGCRIFFCDQSAEEWQQEEYERFHARLKRLHEELHIPYFYIEWRAALRAVGNV